jgi:hypothetical protein
MASEACLVFFQTFFVVPLRHVERFSQLKKPLACSTSYSKLPTSRVDFQPAKNRPLTLNIHITNPSFQLSSLVMDASPTAIQGELAGLLKIGVPVVFKYLRSKTYNAQVLAINTDLEEGTKQLDGLWNRIPENRQKLLIERFKLYAFCPSSLRSYTYNFI